MRRRGGPLLPLSLAMILATLPACVPESGAAGLDLPVEDGSRVEVFTWWAGPGDQEGRDALIAAFRTANPGVEFDDATVEGGAGMNAKSVLAARFQTGDPPDSYQVHAGLELASDIASGKVEDLTYLYDRQGWFDKFPKGLLDALTVDGRIYSVPVNIHRSNLLWFNPKVLAAAGISEPPKTWAQFLEHADTLRAENVLPLSLGPLWTRKHLLENVLLGELGPDGYAGLWTGRTEWSSAAVHAALEVFVRVLATSDVRTPEIDWQPTLDRMAAGTAAYAVTGDWAYAYLSHSKGLTYRVDYDGVTTPGSAGIFNFLSDTFALTRGAAHRSEAESWLILCGSVAGQDVFNPRKGSIPARLDSDSSKYQDYLGSAQADWRNPDTRFVGSLTHGVVTDTAWSGQIDNALGVFIRDRDTVKFAEAVAKSYIATR